ncbi:MAG TPA: bifunctional 3-(3-hydroxy-phenyl)propionate/3-hydroxycinnamic acid hydroxylase, partial [Galbitalea sp.]|nr:bifunctional 3-(3-hydroxy-phenyl)propionate/3-hydroxycinnamic acid hydroxylase [Galbitalea sp.]
MTTAETTDFVVVGAGPVGLLSAILLGRKGWRVTVVERWPSRYPMARACTIDHEALRILQSAGVMIDHSDLFEPSRGERGGYQIRNQDGVLLRAINWNRTAESGWANTNGFYQPDLEGVLEAMASAIPSVEIRRGWSAESVSQTASSVTVGVSSADYGRRESISGRWLIGADGANSVVRELVGIETQDAGFEADWLVVDYEPLDDRSWDAFVTQYCDPAQPATAVNSGPGRRRFEFMRRDDITAEELGSTESAWRLMAPWGINPDNARLERHAVYTFRGRWARAWRRGRVLVAGDAAHLMPPFLGQGMCSGLRDAAALAWRLDLVASGRATDRILESYGTERGAHVREIIDEAIAIGRVICELDPQRAAERDAAMLAELADPAALTIEPPHPRLGEPSITVGNDSNAGRLSVQGRVEVDGSPGLFDDVVGGDWELISLGFDPLADVAEELADWFRGVGGTATAITEGGHVRDVD